MVLFNFIDFSSLSSYFELLTGIIVLYIGVDNFRDNVHSLFLNSIKNKIAKANIHLFENEKGKVFIKDISNTNDNLKRLSDNYKQILNNLEIEYKLMTENNINISAKTKMLFYFSFFYCLFIIIFYIGFNNDLCDKLKFNLILFLNNILLLNLITFLYYLFNKHKTIKITFLVIILISCYLLNLIISNFYVIEIDLFRIKLISIIIPLAPFATHLAIELIYYFKNINKINSLKNNLRLKFDEININVLNEILNDISKLKDK
jgi:hypothetical protein